MKIIQILISIIIINISLVKCQWYNIYRYSNTNCNSENEIPALISSKLNICFTSTKYTCSNNLTSIETFYKNDNCEVKDTEISYDSNICNNNAIINCSLDSTPSLPSNSYVAAIYSDEDEYCNDENQIRQYNTIPLETCTYGYIYKCNSKVLTIEKYEDVECTKFVNKLNQQLGCVHNNPFYKVIRNFCT